MVRPTSAGIVLLALDSLCWYTGLLLDDRTLMAAALVLALAFGCALIMALTQWALASPKGRFARRVAAARSGGGEPSIIDDGGHRRGIGWLMPRMLMQSRDQWERLNQDDAVIARHLGAVPDGRGLYRLRSRFVRWHEPFGLLSISRVIPCDTQSIVTPKATDMDGDDHRVADQRLKGTADTQDAGSVRPYVAGDPPKLISWKATAHHGGLMTRETSRDTHPTMIVVCDVRDADGRGTGAGSGHGVTEAQAGAQAAVAMGVAERAAHARDGERLVVTDGQVVADTPGQVRRLLAALMPAAIAVGHDVGESAADGSATGMHEAEGTPDDGHGTPDARDGDDDAARAARSLARAITRQVSSRRNVRGVLLLTARPQGGLARELRRVIGDGMLHVVPVHEPAGDGDTRQPEHGGAHDEAASDGAVARDDAADGPSRLRSETPGKDAAAKGARGQDMATATTADVAGNRAAWAGRILTTISLLAFVGLLIPALTVLMDSSGMWARFAGVALAVIACEANLPFLTRNGPVLRLLGMLAADIAATGALLYARVHDVTGAWAFDIPSAVAALAGTGRSGASAAATAPAWQMPWLLTGRVLEDGFDGMLRQLPPVDVDAAGDAVLIVAVGLVAAAVRCLLTMRRIAPLFAVLPVSAFAADYAFLGHQADWWRLAVLSAAFLLSLWAVRPLRAHWPSPVALAAIITAMSMALTPAAVRLANAVPLSIGDSTGLLSANTINPMVDLKRSLRTGSDSTVLTYQSPTGRQYLRMTTLDRFDGDSWSFDDDLANDANLYGSGIQLGVDGDADAQEGDNGWREAMARRQDNPLLAYSFLLQDDAASSGGGGASGGSGSGSTYGSYGGSYGPYGSYGYGSADMSGTGGAQAYQPSGSASFFHTAEVTIESLRSRFLPVAGTDTLRYRGAGDEWTLSGQTVYSRTTPTGQGLNYTTVGVGLDPITATSGFSRIDAVNAMHATLEQLSQTVPWAQRTSLRAAAVSSGLATQRDGWMLLRVTLGTDGIARDTAGNTVGRQGITSYRFDDAAGHVILQPEVSLNDDLRQRFGVGDDESIGILVAGDGSLDVALRMDGSSDASGAGTGTSGSSGNAADSYTSGGYANQGEGTGWDPNVARLAQLRGQLGYVGMMTDRGDDHVNAQEANAALDHLDEVAAEAKSGYRDLLAGLPANVTALVDRAKAEGIATDGDGYDQQTAAMRWLVDYFTNPANGFVYSLNAPDGDGRSNLDVLNDFLDTRSGYCAHYASALAVLGRAMGVPTRMVLGYNKGVAPANADGNYTVAAKQLHAWVEAWIDGVGWVPFDVTPATPDNGSASDGTDTATSDTTAQDDQDSGQSDQTDTSQDDQATDGQDSATDNQQATDGQDAADTTQTDTAQPVALPGWAAATLWAMLGLAVAAAAALVPRAVRISRRRRRLHAIAMANEERTTGGEGFAAAYARACAQALAELYDTAWDMGVRWDAAAGDRTVAARIGRMAPAARTDVDALTQAALAAAFAGLDAGAGMDADADGMAEPPEDLAAHLDAACRALRIAGQHDPAHMRVARFLFPASLRRSR